MEYTLNNEVISIATLNSVLSVVGEYSFSIDGSVSYGATYSV